MAWWMRRRLKLPSFQVTLRGGGVGRAIHVLEMDSWAQAGRYVGSSDSNNHYLFFPLTSFDTQWRKTYKVVVVSLKWVCMPLNKRQLLQHGLEFVQLYWNWAALQCSPMPVAKCFILCLLATAAFSVHLGPTFAKIESVRFILRSTSFTLEKFGRYVQWHCHAFRLCTLLFILVLFYQDWVYNQLSCPVGL